MAKLGTPRAAAGVLELVCGLLIALNIGARVFALILVLFVVTATFYFHDFWNMTGDAARAQMIAAMKNLSIVGGLLLIAGLPTRRRLADSGYTDV